jgi:O-antigen ligase
MLLLWLATVIAIPLWVRSQDDIRNLLMTAGVVAAGVTVIGLLLGTAGLVAGFRDYGRFNGLLADANSLGFWMAPILPALVLMAARTPAGRRRRLLVGSILILAIGVALTGSRGSALALSAGVVAGFIAAGMTGQTRQARRAIVLVLLALLAAVIIFPALGIQTRSGQSAAGEGFFELGNGSNRSPAWQAALRVIDEAPVVGHGFGATPIIFPAAQSLSEQGQILGRTHNGYLDAAIDLGWPGMIALIGLSFSGLLVAWRIGRNAGPYQALGTILLAGIVGGMVESLFESGLWAAGGLIAFPFWMVVALAHSVRVQQRLGPISVP